MNNETLNSYEYLKRISDTYKEGESLTNMLNSFRLISEDYNKLNNNISEFNYSSYKYDECSEDEQYDFFSRELQFVETLVTNTIYDKTGTIWNWFDIYKLMYSPDYKNVEKIKRRVTYSTVNNNRPIGDVSYQMWNGIQIIDLDIKDAELSTKLKDIIFDELKKYNWFLGICRSASGKGLHIWTKITPISVEYKNKKIQGGMSIWHYLCVIHQMLKKWKLVVHKLLCSKERKLNLMVQS